MAWLTVGSENDHPIELHYEDHGAGRPVVLIHGWPLSGRSWEGQVPALVDHGYRVIAYDRRGFGRSSQPWAGYDYDTLAADLDTLLRELDLREAALVGFSMGGGEVARYLGTRGTGRVAQAVLAAAATPYLYRTEGNPDGMVDDATIAGMEAAVRDDRLRVVDEVFMREWFRAGDRTDLVSGAQRAYHRDIAALASPKGTLDCIAAYSRTDFRGDLARIRVPALVIHGDSDALVPFEVSGRRSHEAIAGSRLVLVEGAPHGLNVSHREQFNQALLDFLAG
jgi:non-heme chloroperoxidase